MSAADEIISRCCRELDDFHYTRPGREAEWTRHCVRVLDRLRGTLRLRFSAADVERVAEALDKVAILGLHPEGARKMAIAALAAIGDVE